MPQILDIVMVSRDVEQIVASCHRSWRNREGDSFAMECRSYSARSLTRPLCATTGVMVQTVQFLDKVVAMPVVFTTGAHGSRRA